MITATSPMTKEEELEQIAAAQGGDTAALDRIITSIVKLIRYEAKSWAGGNKGLLEDLEQVGISAVPHAVMMYDASFGVRFCSYAKQWWRHAMREEARMHLAQGRSGAKGVMLGYYMPRRKIMTEAVERGVDPIAALVDAGCRKDVATGFVAIHIAMFPLEDNEDTEYQAAIDNPEVAVRRERTVGAVKKAIDSLPERLRHIIMLRHISSEKSLSEIGRGLGISRERTRQLEGKAMRMLREQLVDIVDFDVDLDCGY